MKKQLTFLLLASALTLGACSHHKHQHCPNGKCDTCTSCSRKNEENHMNKTPAYFEFDSYLLSSQDKEHLNKIAKRMRHEPNEKIQLFGYTDNIGTDEYNMNLARERAQAAADYLETRGVDPRRISLKAYGASHFADSNDTAQGRALNRRVEISFTK